MDEKTEFTEEEAVLRYRLQMVAIIRIGTMEVANKDGERMAEMLQAIAAKASVMHFQKGNVAEVAEAISGTLGASHIDGDMVIKHFGRRRRVESAEVLERIAWEGISA